MQPVVSIITVCYDEAQNIRATCDSVVAQDGPYAEWIVIDGGSQDGTEEILQTYRHKMAYFVSEPDKGIYHAMNKGIAQASGEYLLFLNGGDALADAGILQKVFLVPQTADILFGDIRLQNGRIYKSLQKLTHPTRGFFLRPQSLNHQATFIKRVLFDRLGLYDDTLRFAADYEWFVRAFKAGARFQRLDHVISIFAKGGASEQLHNQPKILAETMAAQQKHFGRAVARFYAVKNYALLYAYCAAKKYLWPKRKPCRT